MIYLHMSGGLGNQLFQLATAFALQQMQPDEITVDTSSLGNAECCLSYLAHAMDNIKIINSKQVPIMPIRTFLKRCLIKLVYLVNKYFGWKASCDFTAMFAGIWNRMGFYPCPMRYKKFKKSLSRDKMIYGYFQSHMYFDHMKDIILNKFQVTTSPTPNNAKLLQGITSNEAVCIHIRRGDYVKLADIHLVCNEKYYIEGMRAICKHVKEPVFYIFSDDIEWCKTNIAFEYKVIFVEENNPDYEELRLMSACKHFVISNSSFSWWAQYLSTATDKVVVAPSKWFNEEIPMDIWMPDWHVLKINRMGT